jgi:hypothetical protein
VQENCVGEVARGGVSVRLKSERGTLIVIVSVVEALSRKAKSRQARELVMVW